MKKPEAQYRHGDVFIRSVPSIPKDAVKKPGLTLAEGEVTGHHHTLECPSTEGQLFERDGKLYFRLKKDSALTHQEHARLPLPAGNYEVIIQREYQPKAAPRKVVD